MSQKISPTEAIKLFDVSKPTLYKDMEEGNVTYDLNDKKKRRLAISELERVYEYKSKEEEAAKPLNNVKSASTSTVSNVNIDPIEFARLQVENEMLKKLLEEKEEAIEKWESAFNKAQSTADKIVGLIEDKRTEQEKEDRAKLLESQIRKLRIANDKANKNLQAEKQKTAWQKIFG